MIVVVDGIRIQIRVLKDKNQEEPAIEEPVSEEETLMELVLDFLRKNGPVSVRTICRNAHRRVRAAGHIQTRHLLEELAKSGLVKRLEPAPGRRIETWAPEAKTRC